MELLRATQQQAHDSASPCLALAATRALTHPMLDLQKRIGNRAVLRLLKPKTLQARLAMNQPGDVYEQESDGVADLVKSEAGSPVQRKCACGGAGPTQDALERMVSHRVEAHIGAGTPVTRIDFLAVSPCASIARNGSEETRIVTLQRQTDGSQFMIGGGTPSAPSIDEPTDGSQFMVGGASPEAKPEPPLPPETPLTPDPNPPGPAFCDEPPRPDTSVCIIRPDFGGGFCNVDPPTGDMLDPPECFPAESTPEPAFCDEPPRPGTSVCIIRPASGGGFCNVDPPTGDMLDPPECFPAESTPEPASSADAPRPGTSVGIIPPDFGGGFCTVAPGTGEQL